jgi:hypothetical protein
MQPSMQAGDSTGIVSQKLDLLRHCAELQRLLGCDAAWL